MKKISLYIHVPFCKKKCLYCDFVSYEDARGELIEKYFRALYEEIKAYRDLLNGSYTIETVFIGGGTPNYVDVEYIEKLMQVIFDSFDVDEDAEITMEANPNGHSSIEDMARYKKRVSTDSVSVCSRRMMRCWRKSAEVIDLLIFSKPSPMRARRALTISTSM